MRKTRGLPRPEPPASNGDARARVFAVLLVLFTASIAAIVAHLAIDLIGDVVLVRDTYDDEAHASRLLLGEIALAGGIAMAWMLVTCAFSDARMRGRSERTAIERIVAASLPSFVWRVEIAAIAFVGTMGFLDARLDGAGISTIGDLFGGSTAVGIGVTFAVASGLATLVFVALRWVGGAQRAIVAIVCAILADLVPRNVHAGPVRRHERHFAWHGLATALAHRAGKRGPPPLLG